MDPIWQPHLEHISHLSFQDSCLSKDPGILLIPWVKIVVTYKMCTLWSLFPNLKLRIECKQTWYCLWYTKHII
jgi:hypothetical protein